MFKIYWQNFILPYWPLVLIALVCFMISSAAGLSVPLIIKFLIDDALVHSDTQYLHLIIVGIIALYLLRGIFSYIHGKTIAKAGNKMVTQMRENMFVRLQKLDYGYFINTPTGEIISLFTNDLALIQQAVSIAVPDLLVESLNLMVIISIIIYFDWQLSLVTFATLPFIIIAINFYNKKIANLGMVVEDTLASVTGILHQSLLSMRVVQSYVREEYECEKFSRSVRLAADDSIRVQRFKALLIALVEFLASIGLTAIIWYGGRQVIHGNLTIGGMFAFLIYIINIPTPISRMSQAVSSMKLGIVAWSRISRLQEEMNTVLDGQEEIGQVKGKVEFKNVDFEYRPDLGTLRNIDMIAQPGDIVAIIGPSGAGKSSFANLLLRFYDPVAGNIYMDDTDIRTLTMSALRKQIGFIQQQPILFNLSILENIRYGRPTASFTEVQEAAKIANAHEFIMKSPGGYDYVVGELGSNLSGGQRQRIAIARAIIINPPILLLDEPTAALDAEAERHVMGAIRKVSAHRTTFLITHRLSTLVETDRVIYLSNGRIVETGTHANLIKQNGQYAKAVLSEKVGA